VHEGESAIVIPVPDADGVIGDERRRYDPTCALGMPAHITLVTPFCPQPIPAPLVAELADLLAGFPSFDLRFERVGRFPATLYLEPMPRETIVRMTRSIVERWPQWPPYGGAHAEIIPHLTIADRQADEAFIDRLATVLADRLPFEATAREAWLMTSDHAGYWHRHAILPLRCERSFRSIG
jgi:2'-5' RNA ligase